MDYLLFVAAFLIVAISLAHSFLGERFILVRLFKRDNLPILFGSDDFTKRTLRFAWHLTSVAWCGLASILICLSIGDIKPVTLSLVVSAIFFIHFCVALIGSKGKHFSWIVFLLIAVFTLLPIVIY